MASKKSVSQKSLLPRAAAQAAPRLAKRINDANIERGCLVRLAVSRAASAQHRVAAHVWEMINKPEQAAEKFAGLVTALADVQAELTRARIQAEWIGADPAVSK